jgi:hypothetical protein
MKRLPHDRQNDESFATRPTQQTSVEPIEQRRQAIKAAFGILKGKGVFPEDGLQYQLEIRAECD